MLRPRDARRLALALAAALAPAALLAAVAPGLALGTTPALALAFTVAAIALVLFPATAPLPSLRSLRSGLAVASAGVLCMALGFVLAHARGADGSLTDVTAGIVGTAGVLLAGTSVGALVGARVQSAGHFAAVALASSAADIWSVHAPEGVTRALTTAPDPAVLRLLALCASVAPSRAPEALLGFGDVLFAGLYLAATVALGLSRRRTVLGLAAGVCAAGLAAFATRLPLPALPFLGAGVVLAQPSARSIARKDRSATAVAAAFLLAAVVRVALSFRHAR